MSGRRVDLDSRPELSLGTVDFSVPKEYYASQPSSMPSLLSPAFNSPAALSSNTLGATASTSSPTSEGLREPAPMSYIFAIDVSWNAVKSGLVREITQGIKQALYGSEGDEALFGLPEGSKVGIVTFDRTIHYYNLSVSEQSHRRVTISTDIFGSARVESGTDDGSCRPGRCLCPPPPRPSRLSRGITVCSNCVYILSILRLTLSCSDT